MRHLCLDTCVKMSKSSPKGTMQQVDKLKDKLKETFGSIFNSAKTFSSPKLTPKKQGLSEVRVLTTFFF